MVEGKLVDLLPWTHDASLVAHRDLVRHISTLPKNSIVLFESTPWAVKFATNLTNHFLGKKVNDGEVEESLNMILRHTEGYEDAEFQKNTLIAVMDVLHECKTRNIKVISIEPENILKTMRTDESAEAPIYTRKNALFVRKREQQMTRLIKGALQQTRQQIVPCIVGAGHVISLREMLDKEGIKTNVNTAFSKERLRDECDISEKARKLALLGKEIEAKKLCEESSIRLYRGKKPTLPIAMTISKRLQDRKAADAKKIQKRLMRRK